jgi:hypothetical protein
MPFGTSQTGRLPLDEQVAFAPFIPQRLLFAGTNVRREKNRGKIRTVMKPLPLLDQFRNLLRFAPACQVHRTKNSGIRHLPGAIPIVWVIEPKQKAKP